MIDDCFIVNVCVKMRLVFGIATAALTSVMLVQRPPMNVELIFISSLGRDAINVNACECNKRVVSDDHANDDDRR